MRITAAILPLLLAAVPLAGAPRDQELEERLGSSEPPRFEWRADGTIAEIDHARVEGSGALLLDAPRTIALLGDLLRGPADGSELRLESVRRSLAGTHVRYAQYVEGRRVEGAELVLRYDRQDALVSLSNRLGRRSEAAPARGAASLGPKHAGGPPLLRRESVLRLVGGTILEVERLVTANPPFGELAWDFDRTTGALLGVTPDYWFATTARVFDANPVTLLNDPTLRDEEDAATAVPAEAYEVVELELEEGPGLAGRFVRIVDQESPKTAPADPAGSLHFDRSIHGFEEVNALYHIERSMRWIESLGFAGPRAILTRRLLVDAHASSGADQSFYRFGAGGEGMLLFGDGGVDDAEDPDIILHELGHAIQDAIAPFAFAGSFGSQARAAGEGFGDYWAFSAGYEASLRSGRDPFCIADWDARCWGTPSTGCGYVEGDDCLRRVDSGKTMADFIQREQSGVEHRNGEIWASALREIFLAIVAREGLDAGRRIADTIVLESHFGVPPSPSFRSLGRRMLEADRLIYGGANRAPICAAMLGRGILAAPDCELAPRGGFTHFQAPVSGIPIPDGEISGVRSTRHVERDERVEEVRVQVRIRHPRRGDLRLLLTGPNGRTIVLQAPSADGTPDIDTVYGLDVDAREPLSTFVGISARGEWTLTVIDTLSRDAGTLVSWGLDLRFPGDGPLAERPPADASSISLPAVARTPGAAETFFVSDVRLLNRGKSEAEVMVVFTPSGGDGRTEFAAVELSLAPQQQAALDDAVGATFRTNGVGAVEIRGDTGSLTVTSRTFNDAAEGTYGQFVPAVAAAEGIAAGDEPLHVLHLGNDEAVRSNLGFVEASGAPVSVAWKLFDERGLPIDEGSLQLAPFGHAQVPLLGGLGGRVHPIVRAEIVVSGGEGRVHAYGSVIDNRTGDAIFVPARRALRASRGHVPAVIRGEGAHATRWRSDLRLANLDAEEGTFVVTWFDPGGAARAVTLVLAGGESRHVSDVIRTLFGEESGTGRLQIDSSAGRWGGSSRAWTPGGEGSFGQYAPVAGEEAGAEEGERVVIPQLSLGEAFRTNVGFAEITGKGARVRVSLSDASGREVWWTMVELPGGGQRQISLGGAGAPPLANGYAWVDVVSGAGRVVAYGSVVDNRTGDPIWVPGVKIKSD